MPFERVLRLTAVLLLLLGTSPAITAQLGTGKVRGQVMDESDAVVPGVTIEVTVATRVVGTTVTNAQGEFEFPAVPAGRVTLKMALDGFETLTRSVLVEAGGDSWVTGRLAVAALSERVVVVAPAPRPPVVIPPPPPPPEPEYVIQPVPPLDMEAVCGPAKPRASMTAAGTIGAHHTDSGRLIYRLGDELAIDAGNGTVLSVGQNLVVRRYFKAAGARGSDERGELTAGVVQVVRAAASATTAVVIHACGDLREGDLLMPFIPEPMPVAAPAGAPVYRQAARILFGDAGQLMGAPGRLMVIDRGTTDGIRPGQRLTLFRRARGRNLVVGEAIVLVVREDSARIRVERASDAIWSGDSAAPQEPRTPLAAWNDLRGSEGNAR